MPLSLPLNLQSLDSPALLQAGLDAFPDPVFVKDRQHRWVAGNTAFSELLGRPREEWLGKSDPDVFPPEMASAFWVGDDALVAANAPSFSEEVITLPDGSLRAIWTRKFPLHGPSGQVVGIFGIITDITPLRQRQEAVAALQAQLEAQQQRLALQEALLDEVAVPVIPVWTDILLSPLIGSIDSRRAARLLDVLLAAISEQNARFLILDISSVPIVDTAVAGTLMRIVQAAQLLGCRTILVGIRPEIAQTMVGLGIDFATMTTRASLQQALAEFISSTL